MRHLKRRGKHRAYRPVEQKVAQPRDQLAGGLGRELGGEPARQLARRHVEVARGQPLGAARDQGCDVNAGDLLRDVVLRQHAAPDHRADARGHQLPVRGNQRRVRDR
jgi:hypothetical protein